MSTPSLSSPPEFLGLAAHPLRWRVLGELARSDRIVHELSELTGERQSLISYHLGKLREGRLVSARPSSADRRDTYYGLDLPRIRDLLSIAGEGLHPGLRLGRAPPQRASPRGRRWRVLFLCTGNSARSQMAEALAKAGSGGRIDASSAGSRPKPLHPNAVRAMEEDYGIDLTGHASKHLDVFADRSFDRVITLCDRVREVCPEFPGCPESIHWSIADPATGRSDDETFPLFRLTAAELASRIEFLMATLMAEEAAGESKGEKADARN